MDTSRNRIVNFRVSEEEFQRLKAASTLQNASCLSEFARQVTLRVASGAEPFKPPDLPEDELRSLDRRLVIVESNVARLIDSVAKPSSNPPKDER